MNQRGVDALVQAAVQGQRQIRGRLNDSEGGLCALGVLCDRAPRRSYLWLSRYHHPEDRFDYVAHVYGLRKEVWCEVCPPTQRRTTNEIGLITHLNDVHGWDFLTIARKLGEVTS